MLDYDALDLRRFGAGSLVQLDDASGVSAIRSVGTEDLVDTVKAPVGSPTRQGPAVALAPEGAGDAHRRLWTRGEVTTALGCAT